MRLSCAWLDRVCAKSDNVNDIQDLTFDNEHVKPTRVNLLARVVVACLCSDERSAVWLKSFDGHG